MKEKILLLAQECIRDINSRIVKSNDSTDVKSNHLFKPLVYLAQQECDKLLSDVSKSLLERILLCAKVVNTYGAGNCMMQSFVAFDQIIKKLLVENLINMDSALSISICTTKDHSFLIIDEIACDPWAKYCGPIEDSPYGRKKRSNYFSINSDWQCYDGAGYDATSTEYTFKLVSDFSPTAITSAAGDGSSFTPPPLTS